MAGGTLPPTETRSGRACTIAI